MSQSGVLCRSNRKRIQTVICTAHPSDVARTEHLTFICSDSAEEVGPTNNWMSPGRAAQSLAAVRFLYARSDPVRDSVFDGPTGSPMSKVGIEITDSPYVVANMRIMTRMGQVALDHWRRLAAALSKGSTRSAICPRIVASSAISPSGARFGASDRVTAATPCSVKMSRAAHRQHHRSRRRLARRAHADPRHRRQARRNYIHRGGVPVGVQQDQPGDDGAFAGRRVQSHHGR